MVKNLYLLAVATVPVGLGGGGGGGVEIISYISKSVWVIIKTQTYVCRSV